MRTLSLLFATIMMTGCATAQTDWQSVGFSDDGLMMDYSPKSVRRNGAVTSVSTMFVDEMTGHARFTISTIEIDCGLRKSRVVRTEVYSQPTKEILSLDKKPTSWMAGSSAAERYLMDHVCA